MSSKIAQPDSPGYNIAAAAAIGKHIMVGLDGDVCGAGAKCLGVSELAAASGEQVTCQKGIVLVYSGDAITAKDPIKSNAAGKAIPAVTLAATIPADSTPVTSDAANPTITVVGSVLPEVINGYALDAATGADELIRVLIL